MLLLMPYDEQLVLAAAVCYPVILHGYRCMCLVLCRFNFYMYKKGHTGMVKVKRATEDKPGSLEIKVRIGGNDANTGTVKDLKQLSGYHLSCLAMNCCCASLSFTSKRPVTFQH